MNMLNIIQKHAARVAMHRKLHSEVSALSDAELNDLNLSYAQVVELARRQAYAS